MYRSRETRKRRVEDLTLASTIIHAEELAATDSINADPSKENIEQQIELMKERFHAYYKLIPNKTEVDANLDTARRLRLIPFRVIGHRFVMNLIPHVTAVLRDPASIDYVADDDGFKAFRQPDATLEGQRGRVHHGDEARLGAALYLLLVPVAQQTMRDLPDGILNLAISTTTHLKEMAKVKLTEMRSTPLVENSPFVVQGDNDTRTHQQRFLEYQAFNLPIDPTEMFIETNLPNQIEHLLAAFGDLYRKYDKKETPYTAQLPTSLGALNWFRMLAYLRNEIGGEIEFDDRYVWRGSVGKDRYESKRKSLLSVEYNNEHEYWDVSADRAPFTVSLFNRPGRCPGKDIVTPRDSDLAKCEEFIASIFEVTGTKNKFPTHLIEEGISEPDVISAYSLAVVDRLHELGVLQLTQEEFTRFLGPTQQSDGALVYARTGEQVRVID